MQFVVEWIRNIIVFLLLATMLHMLLPNSNLQKYVKFVVSLLLVVLILTPLFKLFQTDIQDVIANASQDKYMANGSIENKINEKKKEIQASQRAYILEQMAVQMKKQVGKELEKQYGMAVMSLQIKVPEDKKEVKSQQDIQSVLVTLQANERSRAGAIETIQKVDINSKEPRKTSEQNTAEMKQFFSNKWQLEENKIKIQVEGGIGKVNE
ncbi:MULTISPECIES: stage III sporulation protein AF [unclassified Bacillus (in: firmicutes)]|uniref:stage III sporulation protein AF n=1 Tax=unclassified Bacillus (in: firmicutes) TaxID=185979 RepID=UPI0008EDC536|nr:MULTISPECIES: stage III sporulation protein AF [unclassified Bacillus (in: firmicutes)]SFI49933.1 stage III sporulation protein AF [Bacillus sp. 71mf]SFS48990.1 stage III sporulation protein AF [Bacillus sp. 103mf]